MSVLLFISHKLRFPSVLHLGLYVWVLVVFWGVENTQPSSSIPVNSWSIASSKIRNNCSVPTPIWSFPSWSSCSLRKQNTGLVFGPNLNLPYLTPLLKCIVMSILSSLFSCYFMADVLVLLSLTTVQGENFLVCSKLSVGLRGLKRPIINFGYRLC